METYSASSAPTQFVSTSFNFAMTIILSFGTTISVFSRDGFIDNTDDLGKLILVLTCVIMSGCLDFLEDLQKDRRESLLRESRWYLMRKTERTMRKAAEATRWESLMASGGTN